MITIERADNGKIKIFTPYNKDFVDQIHNIGSAKWNKNDRCWMVKEEDLETVRKYMMEIYGETDLPDEGKKVTVKVTALNDLVKSKAAITLFGKEIARAYNRDSGARVGEDVTLINGKFGSGGSAKNWLTTINKGSIFLVKNVSENMIIKEKDNKNIAFTIVESKTINKSVLQREKGKLLVRLAEINKLLKEKE